MKNKSNNLTFLFGAGISQPAGIINTNEITSKIFTKESKYFLGLNPKILENGFELLEKVKTDMNKFYTQLKREMNYEDYYYIIDSISEDERLNFENPIVTYYAEILFQKFPQIFNGNNHKKLLDITIEVKNYIENIIVALLNKEPDTLDHLEFLSEAERDEEISEISLFTLNYDKFLEKFLDTRNIKYSDGFVRKKGNIKIWKPKSFNSRVSIFKLHGSIDWHYNSGTDFYDSYYYKSFEKEDGRPILLIGSFNKLSQYNRSINFELQCMFANKLESSNYLVIGGYSFRDQGINTRIINWLVKSNERKLIIIHKNEEELKRESRPAIKSKWDNLKKRGNILIINKFVDIHCKLEWKEIKKLII